MNKADKALKKPPVLSELKKSPPKAKPNQSAKEKSGKGRGNGSSKLPKSQVEKPTVENISESNHQMQFQLPSGQQLSFLGALVAQRALRKFMAPHRGLFSKLNLRRYSRLSLSVDGSIRLPIQFEPTYQLGPVRQLVPHRVRPVLEEVSAGIIDRAFKRNVNIDPGSLAKTLSNDLRVTLKGLGQPRFKYVVHIIITRLEGQSMFAASRVLWNPEFDRQFSFQHARDNFLIHVTVFAYYHD
nr:Tctex 1 [Hymenolepis microstoma]